MLGNLMCWIMAIALIFSKSMDRNDMFLKFVLAMGFILVGAVCKLVDAYREVNKAARSEESADSKSASQNNSTTN
jgi:hypothetical protein